MNEDIERKLYEIFKTQEYGVDDKLTQIVNSYAQEELDENSLDMVYAARKEDLSEFIRRLNSKY